LDSDRDGIPDGLESSGELFGGPNYSNYGIHYWEGDGRLKWAYIMGRYIDGLYIRNFIDTTYAPWGFILIKTEWELDTMLGVDGWDTDNDGLDDFSEYLWHSCPLLRYSDPTAGALNDHHKVQHQFVTPRPDWVAGFQDWDDDGIPNGAELYYMAELGYGILDPYCSSSDWDQYTDREEWMSWQYKNCDMCDYPLDDPLPYVVRNGCHPLLPAYPVPNFTHLYDDITIPFSDVITAARGISGSSGISASIKNSYSLSAGLDLTFIPSVSIKETYGTEATTTWSLSESWEMSSSYAYDLGSAWVCNYYRITNVGTEPFDYNPYGAHYFSAKIDILWPGSTSEIYLGNQELNGADGLVPFTFRDTTAGDTLGGPTGGGLPEYVDQKICTILHDYVGVSSDSVDAISLSSFNGFYTGLGLGIPAAALTLVTAGALGHALAGYTAVNVALGSAYAGGYAIVNSYETDIYKNFINRFGQQKEMLTVLHSNPTYNTGRDGVFACDNLCDWTSIMAAHRNYVTVMCLYPEASAYVNVVRESPIRDEITDPADSFFTLKEFIDKFSPSGDGPPKIEEFTWSEEVMDTLIQVGCLPYVARGDIWIPDPGSGCDTIDYFGKWVIVSSIDTIAEPFRKDDLCQYHGEYFIGGKTQLRQGDLFIIQYVRDSDLDSLEDNLELITGTNPYNPDTDGDGMYDGAEVMAGLDPLNPNTDNSYYGALDGDEMYYFNTPTSMRPPVETFEGDTIFPSRDAWDVFLNHSPRTTSGHYDFVPWPYNSGGYNSKLDDRYMDANFNGLADWVERYFRDPNNYWNGMFRVEWEGNQSRFNPFGYKDMVLETRGIKVEEGFKHICDTTTLASGNRVLEIIVNDVTGDGSDMWDNSYIYFKLFNCDILATRYLEISYDLWPRTANGKHICIDLIFSDQTRAIVDSTFLDSDGIRMHPAWRPYYVPTDTFHRVTASLAPFEGKIIKSIAIGYEDDPNSQFGRVHAFIDNLSIRNKNIVIDFEPENKPPLGFQVNNMIGTSLGFRAFDALPGLPACSLAQLPSPDPLCTTYIPIDTMVYGPFEKVYELTGYLDPFEKDISDERCWGFTFTCLAEDLEYRLDENSHLGYYVWHESVPQYLMERTDLPKLVPPKTVVDLQIEHPVTRERRMMLDYLAEIGEPITDQWGNSLIPSERNEFDSDGDESWRPVSGNFWRYIDVELPDELTGWLVQRVYFRYQTDLPCVGNLRSYFDHVSLFERRDDYYQDPYHYYTSFGDPIADAYDNNMNDIIDWEEVNIHNVDNLHNDFAKYTYALLLKSNDLGPLTFKVDTLSGDTTWFWFKIDVSTGDTSWSWFNTFAMNPDSTFKLANTWIAPEDSYTTLIDVENFMTAVWEEADPRHIYGYMTHVNADQSRIYSPYMLNRRALDGTKGVLKIDATNTDINRKMLLFDVHQTPPCTLCTKHCLFLMYDGWVDTGKIWLGYKYQGIANEYWFPEFSNTTRFSYRHPVPYTFDAADSSKIVESIWLKAEDSTIGYLDNFRLQRIYYRSFEPNEPPHFLPNDMVSFRNIDSAAAECSVYHVDDAGPLAPEPTHGEYYLKISGEFNGYSPSWFRYLIFDFPFPNELQLTNQSELNFNICYNFNPLISFGNAIIDLELELSGGGTAYLHEYYLLDDKGQTYAPPLRRDGVGDWINVNVNLSGLPADSKVKNISVYFKEPVIVTSGTYEIYIDELIISF
ncbi:hypothetical protein JW877_07715, partial [bacterium]|nr:hypothetical protein [bacterium]